MLFTLAAFAVFTLLARAIITDRLMTERIDAGLSGVYYVSSQIESGSETSVTDFADTYSLRVLVLDSQKRVRYDSRERAVGFEFDKFKKSGLFVSPDEEYSPWSIRQYSKTPVGMYVSRAGNGYCVIIRRESVLRNAIHRSDKALIACFAGFSLISLIFAFVLTRINKKPIKALTTAVNRISQGKFEPLDNVNGEFAPLASSINALQKQFAHLEKSRTDFVSNASHELKTPLSTIKLLIEDVMTLDIPKDKVNEFLKDADSEVDRASALVSDMLSLTTSGSDMMTIDVFDTNLGDILTDVVKRLSPLARENGIDIKYSAESRDSLQLDGDADKLAECFYNIIENAIKYTPRSGTVTVTARKSGRVLIAEISDNGIGIAEEHLPHLFERFYRVDTARSRESGGTGLGLSICKQITDLHSGEIDVTSEVNKGTRFTITLPVKQP